MSSIMELRSSIEETLACPYCNKTFTHKAGLSRHVRVTHEKKKPFECHICKRRFGYKIILMEHQNIHYGIKPYACVMCAKRFAARSNLQQHQLSHQKPFHCRVCSKRFDCFQLMQKHLHVHPANSMACNRCTFVSPNQISLSEHMEECHPPQVLDILSRRTRKDPETSAILNGNHSNAEDESENNGGDMDTYSIQPSLHSVSKKTLENICTKLAEKGVTSTPKVNGDDSMLSSLRQELLSSSSYEELPPTRYHEAQYPYLGMPTGADDLPELSAADVQTHSSMPEGNLSERPIKIEPTAASSLSQVLTILQNIATRPERFEGSNFPEITINIAPAQSKSHATTQSSPHLSGLPNFDDTMAHYVSTGKLYHCQHCDIFFRERAIFVLHTSLHGNQSPWECSVCQKVCQDRNEFHMHLVNQKH